MFIDNYFMMKKDKVKIKLNIKGIDIEIESSPDQIQEAIKQVITSIEDLPSPLTTQRQLIPASCKEAIEILWREGWFTEPKRLIDVWKELGNRGYNYDRSAIAHALHNLSREGILTRIGKARRYRYVQKTPYIYTK